MSDRVKRGRDRLRRRATILIMSVGVIFSISLAMGAHAEASTVLFNKGKVLSWNGCRVRAQYSDYGFGSHKGYAQMIWVKQDAVSLPARCLVVLRVKYARWSGGKRVRQQEDWVGFKSVLDYIPGPNVDVYGGSVDICSDYGDNCHIWNGTNTL